MKTAMRKFTILMTIVLVFMLMPADISADSDTTGPVLKRVWFEKTDYTYGDEINIFFEITDDMSGVDKEEIYFNIGSADGRSGAGTGEKGKLVSENIYQVAISNFNFKSGTYSIDYVSLFDLAGNRSVFTKDNFSWENPLPNVASMNFFNPGYVADKTPKIKSISSSIIKRSNGDYSKYNAYPGDSLLIKVDADDAECILISYYCKEDGNYSIGDVLYPSSSNSKSFVKEIVLTEKMLTSEYNLGSVMAVNGSANDTPSINSAWKFKFKYYNKKRMKVPELPIISSVKMNKKAFKPGEEISIKMIIEDKDQYAEYDVNDPELAIAVSAHPEGSNNINLSGKGVSGHLQYKSPVISNGQTTGYLFEGKIKVPANAQEGTYKFMYGPNSTTFQYGRLGVYIDYSSPESGRTFKISSIFSGIQNESLLVGEYFDPGGGVKAILADGTDVTAKMEIESFVDSSAVGVYLVKYKYSKWNSDENKNDLYMSFRWVGITELIPDEEYPGETPLAITDDTLKIGAKSADATISLNGKKIAFNTKLTAKGDYKLSASTKTAKAIVDKSGPAISHKIINKKTIKIVVNDPAGVKTVKYLSGKQTKSKVKSKGKMINKSHTMNAKDGLILTVYAVDKFGNSSIKTIKISRKVKSVKTLPRIYLVKGKTIKLPPAKVSPDYATKKSVKWKSKNSGVAKITKSKIKGIKKGKTVLSVTTNDGKKTAKCVVVVVSKAKKLKSLKISPANSTISAGKSFQTKTTLNPTNATGIIPTYKSSNSKIIKVDKLGKVTAVKKGNATITVRAGGKTAACKVTVK